VHGTIASSLLSGALLNLNAAPALRYCAPELGFIEAQVWGWTMDTTAGFVDGVANNDQGSAAGKRSCSQVLNTSSSKNPASMRTMIGTSSL